MAVAIRERITEKVQPLLEPGEQVQAVIPGQTKSGWLGAIGYLWLILVNRYRQVIATDRRLVVTDSGKWSMTNIKTIVASYPRSTYLGEPKGLWWKCTALPEPLYIHKRFHKDVEQANALRPPG